MSGHARLSAVQSDPSFQPTHSNTMPKSKNTPPSSQEDVEAALRCVSEAWEACCADFNDQRLNSEACLQAAFYAHFREACFDRYVVYVGVKVALPPSKSAGSKADSKKRHVFVDTVICSPEDPRGNGKSKQEVLVSVELKYKPQVRPGAAGLKKDLKTLSQVRNQMVAGERFHIPIERHTANTKRIIVSPHAKMVLGIFLSEDSRDDMKQNFWQDHKPTVEGERWAKRMRRLPPKLGVCFAFAGDGCVAESCYLGAPFEFAQPSLLAEHVAYP